jgi:hypothetical protein
MSKDVVQRLLYDRKEAARSCQFLSAGLDYLIAAKQFNTRRIGKKVLISHREPGEHPHRRILDRPQYNKMTMRYSHLAPHRTEKQLIFLSSQLNWFTKSTTNGKTMKRLKA